MSRVSILMPIYNCEKFVAEAIESILSQTFTDFELLLLDDCSTDNTAEVVKLFSDERIIYHNNKKNLGLANNLNVGLQMAKGEYIARMDGDDISLPERLQTQVDFLDTHPDVDLCSCGLHMFGMDNAIWVRESDPEQIKITMLFYSPVLHATSVWRKESFEKHNLYYDQNTFPAEDYDLWSRAIFYCKLVNIPDVLYKYRIHGIQVTKTDDRAAEKSREIQLNYLKKALPSLNEEERIAFLDEFMKKKNLDKNRLSLLKSLYESLVRANKVDAFFAHRILEKRLRRHYQGYVFEVIKSKPFVFNILPLLSDLRLKQIVKLFIS